MDKDRWKPKHSRSSIEILADILRLLRLGNISRIQINHYANLDRKQSMACVDSLLETGLLEGAEEEMGLPSYRNTNKGLTVLDLIENIKEMQLPESTIDALH